MGGKAGTTNKPKFKDWKPGEYRITAEVITPEGNKIEMYIPHVTEHEGGLTTTCLVQVLLHRSMTLIYIDSDLGQEIEYSSVDGKCPS